MTTAPVIDGAPGRVAGLPMWVAGCIFAVLSTYAAVASAGFLETDACVHYLYARFALQEHHLLVNVWGRPFCTALYMLPAVLGGRIGVRLTSLALALATAWICYRIARRQGYEHPQLAFIFLLGQPLLFLHSFSELTELPFAFLLAMTFLAYQGRRLFLMALLAGLMPAARPEGLGFIVLAAGALIAHRRLRWLPLLVLPAALWSLAGWAITGAAQPWYMQWWQWLPRQWPYAQKSLYDSGWLVHFLVGLPAVVGPGAFPATILGLLISLRSSHAAYRASRHLFRCDLLIPGIALMILGVHSFLYWTGRMASSGEFRYMLTASPMWALLAARGWAWAWRQAQLRRPLLWAGIAVLIPPLIANRVWTIVPLRQQPDSQRAAQAAAWYIGSEYSRTHPRLIATHPEVYYFADISPTDKNRTEEFHLKVIENPPPGVILIWDPMYGMYNADANRAIPLDRILERGWRVVRRFEKVVPAKADSAINRMAAAVQQDELPEWVVLVPPG